MTISLPDSLKEILEQQVASGRYESAEAYVSALVEEDHKRRAKQRVEQMILDGLHSGEPREVTPQVWDELRRELHERQATKSSQ